MTAARVSSLPSSAVAALGRSRRYVFCETRTESALTREVHPVSLDDAGRALCGAPTAFAAEFVPEALLVRDRSAAALRGRLAAHPGDVLTVHVCRDCQTRPAFQNDLFAAAEAEAHEEEASSQTRLRFAPESRS